MSFVKKTCEIREAGNFDHDELLLNTALSENLSLQNIMNTFEEKLLMARMETAVHYITEFEYLLDRIDTKEKKADAPAAYKTKEEKSEHGKSHISGIFRAYFLHI